ncbi:MAG: FHA domain-containing protein [Gammaproteobacteria bacterium]|nr:FHA domain-containing protein [Gammaproteobacteria bacterium]
MGKLIVTDAAGAVSEVVLDKERVSIGRHPDNDICLADKSVSGRHAVIVTILQDSFLEDLDSTNGTQVNGRQVAKHSLSHGDTVTVGRNFLRYESALLGQDDALDQTVILKPSQIDAATASAAPVPTAPPVGRLEVISGANAGRGLELTKALTTLGKPGVQVVAITRRADGYYIVHVSGDKERGQPRLNGTAIGSAARRLETGDEFELSGTRIRFVQE